jgi:hypothetical protein
VSEKSELRNERLPSSLRKHDTFKACLEKEQQQPCCVFLSDLFFSPPPLLPEAAAAVGCMLLVPM